MIHLNVHLAQGRLAAALDLLSAALARHDTAQAERQTLAEERYAMMEDRTRLAAELDSSLARAQDLEQASRVVEGRLAGLGAALRSLAQE